MMRAEHPKPQFMRDTWQNLNGEWQFEIDHGNSGEARGLHSDEVTLSGKINVPFCPESKLSGVEYRDFMSSVWYKREIEIEPEQLNGRVFLHFGAVDYSCTVFINGKRIGTHVGGYVSFKFEITDFLHEGKNTVCVNAVDDTRSPVIPSGKQSNAFASYGCFYTRTTGIWQTVWLEFTPKAYIKSIKIATDINAVAATVTAKVNGNGELKAEVFYEGKAVGSASVHTDGDDVIFTVPLSEKHLWEVGNGRLYDLKLSFGEDTVSSYFGLRSLRLDGCKFLINGKSVFQRLVLDQGFYPDGIYTAPSDKELEADIDRSLALGFNGARLHEKVFEERFLYYADRKGYIVWGEYPNWGLKVQSPEAIYHMLPEWLEILDRDMNHPSIVGWCPFNETAQAQYDGVISLVYRTTKNVDPSRPCIDSSGWYHVESDIMDVHNYCQDPEKFNSFYENITTTGEFHDIKQKYNFFKVGMPFFVSEYGGIGWSLGDNAWGYGTGPKTEEEFLTRLKGLTDVLLDNEGMFGFCYTQLTDVEQEQNGLYTYDRRPKFDLDTVHAIFSRKAAIED